MLISLTSWLKKLLTFDIIQKTDVVNTRRTIYDMDLYSNPNIYSWPNQTFVNATNGFTPWYTVPGGRMWMVATVCASNDGTGSTWAWLEIETNGKHIHTIPTAATAVTPLSLITSYTTANLPLILKAGDRVRVGVRNQSGGNKDYQFDIKYYEVYS